MNQAILDFVGKQLIDIGNKIIKGECELTDEQAGIILGTVGHIEMTKEEACQYINISRSRFDDHVQDVICNYYNVPLDSEQAAYLIGYLVGKMYYKARRLFCSY